MYERSTNSGKSKKRQTVQPLKEASDPQRMGTEQQWSRSRQEVSDPSSYSLPVAKGFGARHRNFSKWQASPNRSPDKGAGTGKPKTQRSPCHSAPGTDVVKKKDELGLTNRSKGATYSNVKKERIIAEIENFNAAGIKKTVVLKNLNACRSTYYGWLRERESSTKKLSALSLSKGEKQAVIDKKKAEPHMSHRKISGYLRHDGYWISPSSCYRILRALGGDRQGGHPKRS